MAFNWLWYASKRISIVSYLCWWFTMQYPHIDCFRISTLDLMGKFTYVQIYYPAIHLLRSYIVIIVFYCIYVCPLSEEYKTTTHPYLIFLHSNQIEYPLPILWGFTIKMQNYKHFRYKNPQKWFISESNQTVKHVSNIHHCETLKQK